MAILAALCRWTGPAKCDRLPIDYCECQHLQCVRLDDDVLTKNFGTMLTKYILTCFIVALSTLLSTCFAKELTIMEFDNLNMKERKYIFVYFYSGESSCKSCPKILFTWDLLEKRVLSFPESRLIIGQVNCDIHKELCTRERVNEVPLMKLYTALDNTAQLEFLYDQDDVDLTSLEGFLRQKLPNSVIEGESEHDSENEFGEEDEQGFKVVLKGFKELSDDDFAIILGAKGDNLVYFYTPWCTTCKKLEPKWEILFKTLEIKSTRLSRINCANYPYACKYYQVEDYPTLLWISDGHIKMRLKSLMHLSLSAFINTVKRLMETIEEPHMHFKETLNLNNEDFRSSIINGFYFVHFTVPWSKHCTKMEPEWRDLLEKASQMKVKMAKVDCSVNEKLCNAEQVDGYPTLYLYRDGIRLGEYEGTRTTESFLTYLQQFHSMDAKDEL